jgi:hypothetical protein
VEHKSYQLLVISFKRTKGVWARGGKKGSLGLSAWVKYFVAKEPEKASQKPVRKAQSSPHCGSVVFDGTSAVSSSDKQAAMATANPKKKEKKSSERLTRHK